MVRTVLAIAVYPMIIHRKITDNLNQQLFGLNIRVNEAFYKRVNYRKRNSI